MTGSRPASRQILLEARLLIRAEADALSVKFAATTVPRSKLAFFMMESGEAPRGGAISPVTTNPPV